MVEYQIYGTIIASDDAEMLSDLTWLKDNYGTIIVDANARNTGTEIKTDFSLIEPTFNEAVTTLNALKSQYGSDFQNYGFQIGQ